MTKSQQDGLSDEDTLELWTMCWSEADDTSRKHYFETVKKLYIDTMRENERLREAIEKAPHGDLCIGGSKGPCNCWKVGQPNKHPDVAVARQALADGDFLGTEESEKIIGDILSKT